MQPDWLATPQPAWSLRLSPTARAALVGLGLSAAALLAVAARLQPDPRGYGTHEQLGLPPCAFKQLTGTPCPSCGLTTSVTCMVHGRLRQALAANPTGCLCVVLAAALVPWSWTSAVRGRLWGVREPDRWILGVVGGLVSFALLVWAVRLAIRHLS